MTFAHSNNFCNCLTAFDFDAVIGIISVFCIYHRIASVYRPHQINFPCDILRRRIRHNQLNSPPTLHILADKQ